MHRVRVRTLAYPNRDSPLVPWLLADRPCFTRSQATTTPPTPPPTIATTRTPLSRRTYLPYVRAVLTLRRKIVSPRVPRHRPCPFLALACFCFYRVALSRSLPLRFAGQSAAPPAAVRFRIVPRHLQFSHRFEPQFVVTLSDFNVLFPCISTYRFIIQNGARATTPTTFCQFSTHAFLPTPG